MVDDRISNLSIRGNRIIKIISGKYTGEKVYITENHSIWKETNYDGTGTERLSDHE